MVDQRDYEFNRKKTEEMLGQITDCCCGLNTPLTEYIRDASGALSDTKIEKLADGLLDAMRSRDMRYKYYGIEGAAVRFIRLYIYLAARVYEGSAGTFGDLLSLLEGMADKYDTLDALILCENGFRPAQDEEEEQYVGEYIRYPSAPAGFFSDLDKSYRMLAGHDVTEEFTDEELTRIWEREEERRRIRDEEMNRGKTLLEEKYGGFALKSLYPGDADLNFDIEASYGMDPSEYADWQYAETARDTASAPRSEDPVGGNAETSDSAGEDERSEESPDSGRDGSAAEGAGAGEGSDVSEEADASEEEIRTPFPYMEMLRERYEQRRKRERAWKDSFDDPEKFLNAFREFRGLFFEVDLNGILSGLREGIIYFLACDGKSALADNEEFLRLYVQLDRAYRRIRQSRRGR